jgi:hypothetical protein
LNTKNKIFSFFASLLLFLVFIFFGYWLDFSFFYVRTTPKFSKYLRINRNFILFNRTLENKTQLNTSLPTSTGTMVLKYNKRRAEQNKIKTQRE